MPEHSQWALPAPPLACGKTCRARRNCAGGHGLRREAPRRLRAGEGPQKLAACACGRKRRRRWRFAGAVHDAVGLAGRVVAIARGIFAAFRQEQRQMRRNLLRAPGRDFWFNFKL